MVVFLFSHHYSILLNLIAICMVLAVSVQRPSRYGGRMQGACNRYHRAVLGFQTLIAAGSNHNLAVRVGGRCRSSRFVP